LFVEREKTAEHIEHRTDCGSVGETYDEGSETHAFFWGWETCNVRHFEMSDVTVGVHAPRFATTAAAWHLKLF
jgi:hypothetical protein